MSRNSFPRPEHTAALRRHIEQWLVSHAPLGAVSERAVNHYRCSYRWHLRPTAERDWAELEIHFQVAERLLDNGGTEELDKILDSFWKKNFAAPEGLGVSASDQR